MIFDFRRFFDSIGWHRGIELKFIKVRASIPVALETEQGKLIVHHDHVKLELTERSCSCCNKKTYWLDTYVTFPSGFFTVPDVKCQNASEVGELVKEYETISTLCGEPTFKQLRGREEALAYSPITLDELLELAAKVVGARDDDKKYYFETDMLAIGDIRKLMKEWCENPEIALRYAKFHKSRRVKWEQ